MDTLKLLYPEFSEKLAVLKLFNYFNLYTYTGISTGYKSSDEQLANPILIGVFEKYNKSEIRQELVNEVLDFLIQYYVRAIICGRDVMTYNEKFNQFNQYIKDKKNIQDISFIYEYFESLKGSIRFVEDKEFREKFKEVEIYKISSRFTKYILVELNNYGVDKELEIKGSDNNINIEHVNPKGLEDEYKYKKGGKIVYANYVDRIGNLTLLEKEKNAQAGNYEYEAKLDIFKESNIELNRYFDNITELKIPNIKKRTTKLVNDYIKKYPYPLTK